LAQNSSPSVNKSTRILTFSNYETRSKNLLGELGLEIVLEDRKMRQLAILKVSKIEVIKVKTNNYFISLSYKLNCQYHLN